MGSKFNNLDFKHQSPLDFVDKLNNVLGRKIDEIEFSTYISGGQGITLERKIERIKLNNETSHVLQKLIDNLKQSEELALHSNVYKERNKYCIPLIDFSFEELTESSEDMLQKICTELKSPLYLYRSGRSYHGYVLKVLTQSDWRRFLGFLLLFNKPKMPNENVDSRWVGHALEQGFGALRLSFNSHFYLQLPTAAKILSYT